MSSHDSTLNDRTTSLVVNKDDVIKKLEDANYDLNQKVEELTLIVQTTIQKFNLDIETTREGSILLKSPDQP